MTQEKTNLWEETIDNNGKSSLQLHEVKKIYEGCQEDSHYFVFDGNSRREAICKKCKLISLFIVGLHNIKDGKIYRM